MKIGKYMIYIYILFSAKELEFSMSATLVLMALFPTKVKNKVKGVFPAITLDLILYWPYFQL